MNFCNRGKELSRMYNNVFKNKYKKAEDIFATFFEDYLKEKKNEYCLTREFVVNFCYSHPQYSRRVDFFLEYDGDNKLFIEFDGNTSHKLSCCKEDCSFGLYSKETIKNTINNDREKQVQIHNIAGVSILRISSDCFEKDKDNSQLKNLLDYVLTDNCKPSKKYMYLLENEHSYVDHFEATKPVNENENHNVVVLNLKSGMKTFYYNQVALNDNFSSEKKTKSGILTRRNTRIRNQYVEKLRVNFKVSDPSKMLKSIVQDVQVKHELLYAKAQKYVFDNFENITKEYLHGF